MLFLFSSLTASVYKGCYTCENNQCRDTDLGEEGQSACQTVHIEGWTSCTLSGNSCWRV